MRQEELERIMYISNQDKQYDAHAFQHILEETINNKNIIKAKKEQQNKDEINQNKTGNINNQNKKNKYIQGWLQHQNIKLKTYAWYPTEQKYKQKPKAIILNYHSLNGHSLITSDLAQRLSTKGYAFHSIDYPCFGQSQGQPRGNISTFSSIAQPCERFFYHLKKQYKENVKIYLIGTSLGGAVAFCVANRLAEKDLSGVILLSPAIRQNPLHMPFKKKLGWFLSILFPNFKLPRSKSHSGTRLSLKSYLQTDPLLYRQGMYTSTLWVMMTTMLNFAKHYKYFNKPYLLIQSGTDKLCDPFLAIDLQKQSPSKDKTTVIIRDMWHNIWFDQRRGDVMKIIQQWLDERSQ